MSNTDEELKTLLKQAEDAHREMKTVPTENLSLVEVIEGLNYVRAELINKINDVSIRELFMSPYDPKNSLQPRLRYQERAISEAIRILTGTINGEE